tara:strand:+ start:908 stop:2623 length:1716 start_codon:yes stop_codon:yes gene_type:complete
MKKIKIYLNFIILLLFFNCISNIAHTKNIQNNYNASSFSSYLSGIMSFNDNEYKKSYKYFKELKGLEDKNLNYSILLRHSLVNLQKFNEAYHYSIKLEKEEKDNFESNLIAGVYYLKNEKNEKAKKYFKKLINLNKADSLQGLLSASLNSWVLFSEIEEREALELINNISPKFDNLKKIQNTFAYCFYNSKITEQKFDELISPKNIDFSRYAFFYANYLHNNSNTKAANEVLNKTLKTYPRNLLLNQFQIEINSNKKKNFSNKFNCKKIENVIAEIFYIIANSLSTQSQFALSNFYLNLSKYLNPNFISFDTLLAENFFNMKDYKNSKNLYKKIGNENTHYKWHAAKRTGLILTNQDKKKEALKFITKTFNEIKNPNIHALYDFAWVLKNNKQFKKSESYYTKVLNLIDPQHYLYPSASDGRGIVRDKLGKWNLAEKDFMNSLSASPNQPYVINYLAYSWIEKGLNIDRSLQMLEKAIRLKNNDGYITDSYGWAFYKLKKYKKAKKYLEVAVRLMPLDPIVNDHYGDSLWMNKQAMQARYYWNYVLKLKDTNKELKDEIKKKLIFGVKLSS